MKRTKQISTLFLAAVLSGLYVVNPVQTATARTTPLARADEQAKSAACCSNACLSRELRSIVENPERQISGLSVVVVRKGKIVYQGYFGKRWINQDNPRKSLKVDRHTKFRIASISKLETAIGIMQMVEQKKIDLDGDAEKYLGFRFRNPNYADKPVTVRMLLSHTSSVRDGDRYTFPPADNVEQAFLSAGKYWEDGAHWAKAGAGSADLAPGKYFAYSNLNYVLLGTILEAVSGERFGDYMRKHVLLPLGCQASYTMHDLSKAQLKQVGVIYRKWDKNEKWDPQGPWSAQIDDFHSAPFKLPEGAESYVPGKNASWQGPQGGLRISAADLSRIMRMFLNGGEFNGVRILKPETVSLMFSPEWSYDSARNNGDTCSKLMLSYGLGPQILTNTAGDRLLKDRDLPVKGHLGDAWGLLSLMMMDFSRKDGFIVLIGGVGADPDKNKGSYSSFFKWEEEIVTAIFNTALK
jgi:CubicO group peptidase (beta-lactamase class C family)